MAVRIQTAEKPDVAQAESNVRDVQEQARQAEEDRKELELLLEAAQEAEEARNREEQEAASIEKEIGESSGG